MQRKKFLLIFIFFATMASALGQGVKIELGKTEISLNQAFTITITVTDGQLQGYNKFPDIPGMSKRGTSSSSSMNVFNGNVSRSQSITQNYMTSKEGTYHLAPFTMEINGQTVHSQGATIKVGPAQQSQNQQYDPFYTDPFEDFFGKKNSRSKEFVELKDDAFLALTTDKDTVYEGEGVNTALAFYVAESNRAPLQFYDLATQLNSLVKQIKPTNAWEENFNIENITPQPVTINGKRYTMYKLFQSTFYPFNDNDIDFPQLALKMIKYKVAKNPSFFGQNRQEDYKTFYSKPRHVVVKPLPPYPLKDAVAVGDFHLQESALPLNPKTGESVKYQFKITGEGNISSIQKPMTFQPKGMEIYPPNVNQNINRGNGKVRGSKMFSYYLIPSAPGQYDLSNAFQWIFFNTTTDRYDTLSSHLHLNVEGKNLANQHISTQATDAFYDQIGKADDTLKSRTWPSWWHMAVNIFLGLLAITSLVFLFKK